METIAQAYKGLERALGEMWSTSHYFTWSDCETWHADAMADSATLDLIRLLVPEVGSTYVLGTNPEDSQVSLPGNINTVLSKGWDKVFKLENNTLRRIA